MTRTRYAVLGMLTEAPMSGYDLKRRFEERLAHFWAESVGQIYPTLHRLLDERLVRRHAPAATRGDPRGRTVYAITAKGRRALREWLEEPARREQVRNELLLKIYFGTQIGPAAVLRLIDHFEQMQQAAAALFAEFEKEIERQEVSDEQRLFWHITLGSGRHVNQARLAWCRDARRLIQTHLDGASGKASAKKAKRKRKADS